MSATDIRFRLAAASDIPALKALVESAYRGDSAKRGWTHEADLLDDERVGVDELGQILANDRQRLVVAVAADGALCGCVCVTLLPATSDGSAKTYLGMLCVSPEIQAAGLGRQLIEQAETLARDTFLVSAMEMTVISRREELIAWYLRRGYGATGERRPFPAPSGAHLEMVVLEKALV